MTTRTVTGTVLDIENGDPLRGAKVSFHTLSPTYNATGHYPKRQVNELTGVDGTFSTSLESGLPVLWQCDIANQDSFQFVLEPSDLPISIEELRAVTGIPVPMTNEVQVALDAGFAEFSEEIEALVAPTIEVGTVIEGPAAAEITGSAGEYTLNMAIPKGNTGDTGATGPAGTTTWAGITDKPTALWGGVNHGAVASTERPSGFAFIQWVGSVEPTNIIDGDTWVVTE